MNCANHPDRERVSFCQSCGKPLCGECTRTIGSAVFCEPCLAARLAAADTATASTGTAYGYAGGSSYAPVTPAMSGVPNPVIAALLGLIPGVGAMYNGQYAKGIVHLIVFAVLVSLADSNGVFGLLVAGWVFYQVIEAHHTARSRRDGLPLPNPFGLNDIGERFGFGKSWAASSPVPPAGWGAPTDSYGYGAPPAPPFNDPLSGVDPTFAASQNRFPVGAIWLIALGLLFFFGSSGFFLRFPLQRLIPFFLIATGVWIFFRKMTNSGPSLADDGTSGYRIRLFRALRGAVWVILVGVLFLLDSFDILSWGRSWPLFIIVAGLMTFFERSVYNSSASIPYSYPGPGSGPAAGPQSAPVSSMSITPATPHEEERR